MGTNLDVIINVREFSKDRPAVEVFQLTRSNDYNIQNNFRSTYITPLSLSLSPDKDAVNLKLTRENCLTRDVNDKNASNGKEKVIRNIAPPDLDNGVVTKIYIKQIKFIQTNEEALSFEKLRLNWTEEINLRFLKQNVFMEKGYPIWDLNNTKVD